MKRYWLIGFVAAGAVILGATLALRRPAAALKEPVAAVSPPAKPDVVLPVVSPPPAPAPANAEAPREPAPVPLAGPKPGQSTAAPKPPAKAAAPKEPLKDPVAREALAFVGADPEAEAYWYEAINDASLSAHERQDLIEDLNEDGLSNPSRPAPADLPLILNRIQILEWIAVDPMDKVNADAMEEAYKDLVNLAAKAASR